MDKHRGIDSACCAEEREGIRPLLQRRPYDYSAYVQVTPAASGDTYPAPLSLFRNFVRRAS